MDPRSNALTSLLFALNAQAQTKQRIKLNRETITEEGRNKGEAKAHPTKKISDDFLFLFRHSPKIELNS